MTLLEYTGVAKITDVFDQKNASYFVKKRASYFSNHLRKPPYDMLFLKSVRFPTPCFFSILRTALRFVLMCLRCIRSRREKRQLFVTKKPVSAVAPFCMGDERPNAA